MKTRGCMVWAVLLLSFPLPGCGGGGVKQAARMSVCGLACVGEGTTETEIHLSDELRCRERFERFEAAHPEAVCGSAWAAYPTPDCVDALILTAVMSIPCSIYCSRDPDPGVCVAQCVAEEVHLTGNCAVCTAQSYLDFYQCLGQVPLTPEEVDACVADHLQALAECHR
jgi:hypothetical protein